MLPIHIGYANYPNRRFLFLMLKNNISTRVMVTGIILAGFGCGVVISNNLVYILHKFNVY